MYVNTSSYDPHRSMVLVFIKTTLTITSLLKRRFSNVEVTLSSMESCKRFVAFI